ncbi:MAG TPA: DUF4383 domain-containing protein [Actinophytocola sp.]|jgi:hypothetical protein|uniref:DUF4383 domain-containing protein n=1 Tax=Actinophytocola sp. TaxID=1872138 RepID=UPI002F947751
MAHRNPGRLAVEVIAATFVVAGVLGLGTGVGAPLTADGAVHLALGFTGLAAARTTRGARGFLIAGGVVFFLWHYGGAVVLTDGAAPVSLSSVNDWLNLWLAVSMIALACLVGDRTRPVPATDGRGVELSVSWREVRAPAALPSARPRRPRPPAGSRPPAPGRGPYVHGF